MKIGCIIQARTSSTRLPNKVLLTLPEKGSTNVLTHVINRVKKSQKITEIIIATTIKQCDGAIEDIAQENEVSCFRGSEKNVLERYYLAAKASNLDYIVRITSDCPCIDAQIIDKLIAYHFNEKNDYTSNTSAERSFPHGLDAEIFSFELLEQAYQNANQEYEKEHVTPYIYDTIRESIKIGVLKHDNNLQDIRVTLDTMDDYLLLSAVFDYFKDNLEFDLTDLAILFAHKPWLYKINEQIIQKRYFASKDEELDYAYKLLQNQDLTNAAQIIKGELS